LNINQQAFIREHSSGMVAFWLLVFGRKKVEIGKYI